MAYDKVIPVFVELESLLNSSLLTYQSSDPRVRDSVPLTPYVPFLTWQNWRTVRARLLKPLLFICVNDGERLRTSFHKCGEDGSKNVFLSLRRVHINSSEI